MDSPQDMGKAAAKGRRAETVRVKKRTKQLLLQAYEVTALWQDEPTLELLIGLLMQTRRMPREKRERQAALGAAEMARLIQDGIEAEATREDEAGKTVAIEADIHVEFPGIPTDDLAAALNDRAFVCYRDKRLARDKPRVWQGKGSLTDIQKLVGSVGTVFVKSAAPASIDRLAGDTRQRLTLESPMVPDLRTAEGGPETLAPIGPEVGFEITTTSNGIGRTGDRKAIPIDPRPVHDEPFRLPSEKRYSAPSNVGVSETASIE